MRRSESGGRCGTRRLPTMGFCARNTAPARCHAQIMHGCFTMPPIALVRGLHEMRWNVLSAGARSGAVVEWGWGVAPDARYGSSPNVEIAGLRTGQDVAGDLEEHSRIVSFWSVRRRLVPGGKWYA